MTPATETVESICQWSTAIFGDGGTDLHASVRLMEVVAKLVAHVVEFESWDADPETMAASAPHREAIDRIHPEMRAQAADVAIVLACFTRRLTGTTLDFTRAGGGSGWHPTMQQAVALNTAVVQLLCWLRDADAHHNKLAARFGDVLPDVREMLTAKLHECPSTLERVTDAIVAFELLTHDLDLQAAVDAKMQRNRAGKWLRYYGCYSPVYVGGA